MIRGAWARMRGRERCKSVAEKERKSIGRSFFVFPSKTPHSPGRRAGGRGHGAGGDRRGAERHHGAGHGGEGAVERDAWLAENERVGLRLEGTSRFHFRVFPHPDRAPRHAHRLPSRTHKCSPSPPPAPAPQPWLRPPTAAALVYGPPSAVLRAAARPGAARPSPVGVAWWRTPTSSTSGKGNIVMENAWAECPVCPSASRPPTAVPDATASVSGRIVFGRARGSRRRRVLARHTARAAPT